MEKSNLDLSIAEESLIKVIKAAFPEEAVARITKEKTITIHKPEGFGNLPEVSSTGDLVEDVTLLEFALADVYECMVLKEISDGRDLKNAILVEMEDLLNDRYKEIKKLRKPTAEDIIEAAEETVEKDRVAEVKKGIKDIIEALVEQVEENRKKENEKIREKAVEVLAPGLPKEVKEKIIKEELTTEELSNLKKQLGIKEPKESGAEE